MIQTQTHISSTAILKKIDEITDTLLQELDTTPVSGLYGGKAGISLYFSYLSRYKQNDDFNPTIHKLINDSFNDINTISSATFSFGISGILWNIHHLKTEQFIDTEDYFDELIPFLGEQMLFYARQHNFDFLHGALGIAFYLLHFQNIEIDSYLSQFMQLLEQKSIEDEQNMKWEFSMNNENRKTFNLSLSHGIASVIIFLSKHYHQKRGRPERTRELLKKSLHYLRSQKNSDEEKCHSLFPASGELKEETKNTRLSWCYGDLGTASAFWQAGNILGEMSWKEEALSILQHAALRRDLQINQVADAGICHGTAGIAHIFNRFYRETKQPFLKDAADYWINETLKLATWNDQPCGYKAWQGEQGWVAEQGILEGIAGIGLVLISYLSDNTPAWDQAFLLS